MPSNQFVPFSEESMAPLPGGTKSGTGKNRIIKLDSTGDPDAILQFRPRSFDMTQDVQIDVIEEDGEVRIIQFTCKCGSVTALKLVAGEEQ